jgi:hypothetical protein
MTDHLLGSDGSPLVRLIAAAKRADWMQVVLNQGPPCFALHPDDRGTFCLRAKRWAGHGDDHHPFVSLADMLEAVLSLPAVPQAPVAPLESVCRHCGQIADVTPRFDPPAAPVASGTRESAEALARYGQHDADCTRQKMRGKCSCGFSRLTDKGGILAIALSPAPAPEDPR